MAGELKHYSKWMHDRPCSVCGGVHGIQQHHLIGCGKGLALREHDLFSMPLCYGCHDAAQDGRVSIELQINCIKKTLTAAISSGILSIKDFSEKDAWLRSFKK